MMNGAVGDGLAAVLLNLIWQGTLVALAAGLALRLVGPHASVARYRIALAALALLVLAPAVTLARRGGWLARTSPGWVAALPEWTRPIASPRSERSGPVPALEAGEKSIDRAAGLERPWNAVRPWLLGGWLLGALLALARLAGGLIRLRRLRRRSTRAPACVVTQVERFAPRLGITRTPEVLLSADAGVPLTFGALKPVVVLPSRFAEDLPAEQAGLVVAHELAHVARRDYLVNLAQCIVEAPLFFHPAVRWLSRVARQEREHCCDERAASVAGDRRQVARALVALEELLGAPSPPAPAPAATGGLLLRRIERLVSAATPPAPHQRLLSRGVLAMAVPLIALATPARSRDASLAPPDRSSGATDDFSVVWTGAVNSDDRLQVQNLAGSIRVVPATGNLATIRARVSGGGLADLRFVPTREAGRVTVCALRAAYGRCNAEGYTWFGSQEEMHRATIDLVVELPLGASIAAASFEGELVLDGVSGDVEARTGSGAITARIAAAPDDRLLEFRTGAGEIRVALPPRFGGTLEARLSNGTVEHEMPLAPIGRLSEQRFHASFGPGRNRLWAASGLGSLVLTRGS